MEELAVVPWMVEETEKSGKYRLVFPWRNSFRSVLEICKALRRIFGMIVVERLAVEKCFSIQPDLGKWYMFRWIY